MNLIKKVTLCITLIANLNFIYTQTVVNVPSIINTPMNIDIDYMIDFIDSSEIHQGMKKIISIDVVNQTIIEDNNDRWPKGTWFRGYYERGEFWQGNTPLNCPIVNSGWTGCHPLVRINDKMIRAHIHANNRYPDSFNYNQNIQKIKDGVDYMIFSQQDTPNDLVEDGGFTWWNYRPSEYVPNTNEDRNQNFTHAYETSHALRAMSEAYLYFKNNNISYNKMVDLYSSIIKAADNLVLKNPNDNQACDFSNNNFRGLGAWALAAAYKVTKDMKYFYAARDICDIIMQQQNTSGGIADGMWMTGGNYDEDDGCGNSIYHDTRIYYHCLALRGLVATMDITPNTQQYLQWKLYLISHVKKAVNHIINYRVSFYDNPPSSYQGQLRISWLSTNGGSTCPKWAYYYYEEVLETIAMLTLYSNFQANFSCEERKSLRNLLLVLGKYSHSNNVGYLENFVQYAYYSDYLHAFNQNRRIYPQDENTNNTGYNTTVIPETASKCYNQGSITLIANLNSAVSYVWDNGLGSGQTKTVSPSQETTYIVTGTDINGCSTSAQITVLIDNSKCLTSPPRELFRTGLNEKAKETKNNADYSIFPNPTSKFINIQLPEYIYDNSQIIISDLLGNVLMKVNLENVTSRISLSNLKPGIYLYMIVINNKTIMTDRIVLMK